MVTEFELLVLLSVDEDTVGLGDCGQGGAAAFDDAPPDGLFFHGWKPLPTAASASGGGDLLDNLLHWAASMANGVPRRLGCSCESTRDKNMVINQVVAAV